MRTPHIIQTKNYALYYLLSRFLNAQYGENANEIAMYSVATMNITSEQKRTLTCNKDIQKCDEDVL